MYLYIIYTKTYSEARRAEVRMRAKRESEFNYTIIPITYSEAWKALKLDRCSLQSPIPQYRTPNFPNILTQLLPE